MAYYRTYKNGIFGCRYKNYYIIRNKEEKIFSVVDEDKNVIKENMSSFWDCQWEIDKMTASSDLINTLKDLYKKEIYILSGIFVDLMEKDNREGLTKEEKEYYEWVTKVRQRKAEGKEY